MGTSQKLLREVIEAILRKTAKAGVNALFEKELFTTGYLVRGTALTELISNRLAQNFVYAYVVFSTKCGR